MEYQNAAFTHEQTDTQPTVSDPALSEVSHVDSTPVDQESREVPPKVQTVARQVGDFLSFYHNRGETIVRGRE